MEYQVGDIVKLKKPHPCGSQEGNSAGRSRFSFEMRGLRPSSHGIQEISGEKYPGIAQKSLKSQNICVIVLNRDILWL